MRLFKSLPFALVLLVANYSTPSEAAFFRNIVKVAKKVSKVAKPVSKTFIKRSTHNLAHDLRVAFGGVLVPREDASTTPQKRVVYCKPKQGVMGIPGTGTGGENTTSVRGGASSTRGSPTATGTRTATAQPSATANIPNSPWKLSQSYSGDTFFRGWDFHVGDDPTHGIVDYVDEGTARSNGLLEVNDRGNAIMRVETTPRVNNVRKSVRITTQFQFNGGLVIMDSVHMPTGCGSWPAFWTNGPNWPQGGEIDIMEGVHDYTHNQATIHTDPGCTIASTNQNILAISGNVIDGTNCAALTTGNQGCGIRANSGNSFGAGFNANGGGIYAMKWDSTGIAVYFFPRGTEPADIAAEKPQPDSWGPAQARWPAASCDPFKFFNNHHAIFDTTLCGDWAGNVWSAAGIPGQEQSCAQRTGFATCEEFVRASGSSFNEAYWEVKSMKIYEFQN